MPVKSPSLKWMLRPFRLTSQRGAAAHGLSVILANSHRTQRSKTNPAGGRFRIMESVPQPKAAPDCSEKVKKMGRDVTSVCAIMLFFSSVGYMQTMPHPMGELGHFTHDSCEVLLFFALWGLPTGIGLTRAWRWARISMLLFTIPLGVAGISGAVIFLFHHVVPMPLWEQILFRTIFLSLCAIPGVVGVWLSLYFMRADVKAYFRAPPSFPHAPCLDTPSGESAG
jgi:hypothetical protein